MFRPDNNYSRHGSEAEGERRPLQAPGWIDMLLVFSLITTLFAVLLPTVRLAREKARAAGCVGNLRRIGQATLMYANDNDGYLPAAMTSTRKVGFPSWAWLLDPYLKTGVTIDRADTYVAAGGTDAKGSWADSGGPLWHCPADILGGSRMSYGVNPWVAGDLTTEDYLWNRHYVRKKVWVRSKRLSEITHPDRVVFAGDTNKFWDEGRLQYGEVFADWIRNVDGPLQGKSLQECIQWYQTFLKTDYTDSRGDCASPGEWSCKGPAYRHYRSGLNSGTAGILFCDGHVGVVPFGKLTPENIFPHLL